MNRIYKVVWSKAKNCYVVASELAKRHTKGSGTRGFRMTAVTLGVAATLMAGTVEAAIGSSAAVTGVTVDPDKVTTDSANVVTGILQANSTTGTAINHVYYTPSSLNTTTAKVLAADGGDGADVTVIKTADFTQGNLNVDITNVITAVGEVSVSDTTAALTSVVVGTDLVTTNTKNFLTGTSEDANTINETITNTAGIERSDTTTTIEGVVSIAESGQTTVGATAGSQVVMDAGQLSVDKATTLKDKLTVSAGGATITGDTSISGKLTVTDLEVTNTVINNMEVIGSVEATGDISTKPASSESATFTVTAADGSLSASNGQFTVDGSGNAIVGGTLTSSGGKFIVDENGNTIAAGTLTASEGKFTVDESGNAAVAGTLDAAEGKFTVGANGNLSASNGQFIVDESGNAIVGGTLTSSGGKFTVDENGNTIAAGTLTASEGKFTVDASGNTATAGTFSAATGNFTVDADGNTAAKGKLDVTGATTLKDTLTVEKDSTLKGKLDVTGATTLKDTLTVEKAATLNDTLTVKGDTELKSNLKVGGTALFNEGKTNQILIDEAGIRIGLSSTQIDDQGFYAGGHTWDAAKAAMGADGRIKGTAFMVDEKTYIDKDGLNANNQKIRNLHPGDLSPVSTDATNGQQLYEVREELQADINRVGAGAAAMANLRPVDMGNKFSMAMGVGTYRSKTAAAIGMFYKPSDRVMINMSGTVGSGHNMIGAGISFALDKVVKPAGGTVANDEVKALKAENAEIKAELAELKAAIKALKAEKKA